MKCRILTIILVFFLTAGLSTVALSKVAWSYDQPNLLIVHSYHPTYQWTQNINKGIFAVFNESKIDINVKIEYMDITKKNDTQYLKQLNSLYRHKYQSTTFDAVLCSDNYAFDFLLNHRADLFPGSPMIFCGINRFQDKMIDGHKNVTGVVEDIDLDSTIEVMLNLHRDLDRVFIWSVVHKRSEKNRAHAVSIINRVSPNIEIIHVKDRSLNQGIQDIKSYKGKAAVFLMSVIRDDSGQIIPVDITARTIADSVDIPIYSLWDFYLGHGIMGGKLISGFEQGKTAAQMALQILDGSLVSKLPIVRKSPNQFMFDHYQLNRFGISVHSLPGDAVVVNKPISFYEKHKSLVLSVATVIMLLGVLIIVLLININRRIKVEKELLEAHDRLEDRVHERTEALSTANDELSNEIERRTQTESRLREQEQFLALVFDSIQDGISVLDRELNIIRTNQTMKIWYSHMLPLEGKKCYQAYRDRSESCEICPTKIAMKTGKPEMNEVPLIQEDGQNGVLEVYAFPMLNKNGKSEAVVEYVRDITERKHAAELLEEREQLYRSLFENNISVMLLIDPATSLINDANPSACSYYGYPKETLIRMKITDINILSEKEVYEEMERAKTEKKNYFNFRHRLSDGTIREVEVYSGPITVGGKSLLCSIVHDVSERKKAESERERLINQLQKALSEVKTLRGFLPICSSCKKIRDDKGYWNQIESYIQAHSEAEFSHSICPECVRKLYPDLDISGEMT